MTTRKAIAPRQLPQVAWQRILKEVRTRTAPTKPRAIKVGASLQEIASQIRSRQTPRFFGLIPEQAALLAQFYPDAHQLAIARAEKVKAHKFECPGVGEIDAGREINWHTDFKNKYVWPVEHYRRLKITSPDGAFDPRIPWEMSRFYHAAWLGQAYLYTEDNSFAQEIVDQISDWLNANPFEFGINWAQPMTTAIRAVNWCWAYYCIVESKALSESFLALWLASIREHGQHLARNLEIDGTRPHQGIVVLAGLAYLGLLFPEFTEAARWKSVALARLWETLERHVEPDGMTHEGSLACHRLLVEAVLSIASLCVVNGVEIPEIARARLRSMLDVIMAYTQPDGLAPAIGGMEDERLLRLAAHTDPVRASRDHRYLLAMGSLALERELGEWAGYIEPTARGWSVVAGDEWQDAFWHFTSDAAARFTDVLTRTTPRPENLPPDNWVDVRPGIRVRARALARKPVTPEDVAGSRGFEAGGLYVMRQADFHMTIDAISVGQKNIENIHSSGLGVTLAAYGKTFLIDPGGSAAPQQDGDSQGLSSPVYPNVLQIESEQARSTIFGEIGVPAVTRHITVHRWVSQTGFDLFEGSHDGYKRLRAGLVHRRQVWFDKVSHLWLIHDQVRIEGDNRADSESEVEFAILFHFAPLPLRVDPTNNTVRTDDLNGANLIVLPLGEFPLTAALVEGSHSPRYGVKEPAPIAKFSGRVRLPVDLVFMLYPHQAEIDFKNVRSAGRTALVNFKKALTPSGGAGPGGASRSEKARAG